SPKLDLPDTFESPFYGWLQTPSRTYTFGFGGKKTRFYVDSEGNRVRWPDQTIDPSKPTILFSGESMAVGPVFAYPDTSSAMVAEALGVQGITRAVSGCGADQAYLRVRDELPRLAEPTAVVTLIVSAQLVRNTDGGRAHYIPEDDGTLVRVAPDPKWWTS